MDRSSSWQFVWSLVEPFKRKIISLGFIGVIWAIFTVVKSYVLKVMVDSMVETGLENLFWPIILYFTSWIMTEFFSRVRDYVVMHLKPYLKKHIITKIANRMLKYEDHYFRQNQPTSLQNGLRNLYDGIDDGIYIIEELFSHCMLIGSTLISMYLINTYFSLVTAAWFLIWGLTARIWARNGHVLAYYMNEARTRLSFNLGDIFSNTSTIKTFNALEHEEAITNMFADDAAVIEYKREKLFFKVWIVQGIFFLIVSVFIFWLLITGYKAGEVTIGDFAMLTDLLHTVYLYLFDFAKDVSELSEVTGKIKQGIDVVYRETIEEHDNQQEELVVKKGDIVFDQVHYKYPESDEEESAVCSKKKIIIPAGTSVALVGPSGSGKTTLMKLLLRLLEPTSGKILIDGQDIAKYDIQSVRKYFALVPQELGLFNRSMKDNIKYGMPDATDKEVIEAAKKAQIHDLINQMPYQYDTIYGSQVGLSGGQKQRLMIARGLLRNAKFFLFDESTSALDMQTEYDVYKNIEETTKGATKLIIAHRLSTIKNVDLILVCDKGEIVEHGTNAELIVKRGLYYSLLNLG